MEVGVTSRLKHHPDLTPDISGGPGGARVAPIESLKPPHLVRLSHQRRASVDDQWVLDGVMWHVTVDIPGELRVQLSG